MISGLIVFAELPNTLALSGIALVVASGLAVVLLDERQAQADGGLGGPFLGASREPRGKR